MRSSIGSIAAFALAFFFAACGDDDSDFVTRASDESSSSVCEDCDESSSSTKSSSSVSPDSVPGAQSSSSTKSSSSVTPSSSSWSSEGTIGSSSSVPEGYVDTSTVLMEIMTDSRDGQTYKTVKIGTQTWMAENLNYAYLQPTADYDSSSFCYENSEDYCDEYGRLYTWAAAIDSAGTWESNTKGCGWGKNCRPQYPVRGVCPEGWHLPDSTEWATLFVAVGYSTAGKTLRSTRDWSRGGNGTDDYYFTALPAGRRDYVGVFESDGDGAYFWSSSEYNQDYVYHICLNSNSDYAVRDNLRKDIAISVRCVKD